MFQRPLLIPGLRRRKTSRRPGRMLQPRSLMQSLNSLVWRGSLATLKSGFGRILQQQSLVHLLVLPLLLVHWVLLQPGPQLPWGLWVVAVYRLYHPVAAGRGHPRCRQGLVGSVEPPG